MRIQLLAGVCNSSDHRPKANKQAIPPSRPKQAQAPRQSHRLVLLLLKPTGVLSPKVVITPIGYMVTVAIRCKIATFAYAVTPHNVVAHINFAIAIVSPGKAQRNRETESSSRPHFPNQFHIRSLNSKTVPTSIDLHWRVRFHRGAPAHSPQRGVVQSPRRSSQRYFRYAAISD